MKGSVVHATLRTAALVMACACRETANDEANRYDGVTVLPPVPSAGSGGAIGAET